MEHYHDQYHITVSHTSNEEFAGGHCRGGGVMSTLGRFGIVPASHQTSRVLGNRFGSSVRCTLGTLAIFIFTLDKIK